MTLSPIRMAAQGGGGGGGVWRLVFFVISFSSKKRNVFFAFWRIFSFKKSFLKTKKTLVPNGSHAFTNPLEVISPKMNLVCSFRCSIKTRRRNNDTLSQPIVPVLSWITVRSLLTTGHLCWQPATFWCLNPTVFRQSVIIVFFAPLVLEPLTGIPHKHSRWNTRNESEWLNFEIQIGLFHSKHILNGAQDWCQPWYTATVMKGDSFSTLKLKHFDPCVHCIASRT